MIVSMVNARTADELVAQLWKMFPYVFRLIRWRRGIRPGLTLYHYEILGTLLERDDMPMSEIGAFVGVAPSNLTPIIALLTSEGLVARSRRAEDRRVSRVMLTAKGRRAMARGREEARIEMQAALAGYSKDELEQLRRAFRVLARLLPKLDEKEE